MQAKSLFPTPLVITEIDSNVPLIAQLRGIILAEEKALRLSYLTSTTQEVP